MALIFFQLTEGCISSQPFLAEWQYSTFPMTPSLIIFLAVRTPLKKFITWPAMKVTLWATHASTISTQS